MKKYTKYIVILALVLFGALLFYKKVYTPKSTYEKVVAHKGDMQLSVFGIGEVSTKDTYSVASSVSAKIVQLNVDVGARVRKGEVIAKLDPVDLPTLLKQSQTAVQKSKSELIALQKELGSLKAQKELLQITFDRYAKLKSQSFASQAEFDKAKADLQAIDAQIASTKARINSAKIAVRIAKESVEALRKKLELYTLRSPIDGIVTARYVDKSQSVLPGSKVVSIVSPKDVWVRAYIDERLSGSIKVGQKASIVLRSHSDKAFEGVVARIEPQSDAVTQERVVDVAFAKEIEPFYLNEQSEVTIDTKRLQNVTLVPAKAVVFYQGKQGVWVDKGGRADFVQVSVLGSDAKSVAIKEQLDKATIIVPSANKKPLRIGSRVF